MSKNIGKLANRYARALLGAVVREQGGEGKPTPAQKVAQALLEFVALWESEKTISQSLLNPMFEKQERQNAMAQIAKHLGMPDIAQRFLVVCFERDRISAVPEIIRAFAALADEAAGILAVQVTTARPIAAEEAHGIEQALRQRLSGELRFSWGVDEAILGGLVVRYGGKVLDGSLHGRLERIERRLHAA